MHKQNNFETEEFDYTLPRVFVVFSNAVSQEIKDEIHKMLKKGRFYFYYYDNEVSPQCNYDFMTEECTELLVVPPKLPSAFEWIVPVGKGIHSVLEKWDRFEDTRAKMAYIINEKENVFRVGLVESETASISNVSWKYDYARYEFVPDSIIDLKEVLSFYSCGEVNTEKNEVDTPSSIPLIKLLLASRNNKK